MFSSVDVITCINSAYEHATRQCEPDARGNLPDIRCQAVFPQTWSSTALGFDGFGGQGFTTAYTVILYCESTDTHFVYFSGQFAYSISGPSRDLEQFFGDMMCREMAYVSQATKRYGYQVKC